MSKFVKLTASDLASMLQWPLVCRGIINHPYVEVALTGEVYVRGLNELPVPEPSPKVMVPLVSPDYRTPEREGE